MLTRMHWLIEFNFNFIVRLFADKSFSGLELSQIMLFVPTAGCGGANDRLHPKSDD